MTEYFSSLAVWFKNVISSVLSWFFDTSNTTKLYIFIVPLLVVGAIFVFFEFVFPLFYHLPNWGVNRSVSVLKPTNNINIKPNLRLIPRKMERIYDRRIGQKIYNNKPAEVRSARAQNVSAPSVRLPISNRVSTVRVTPVNGDRVRSDKVRFQTSGTGIKVVPVRSAVPAQLRTNVPVKTGVTLKSSTVRGLANNNIKNNIRVLEPTHTDIKWRLRPTWLFIQFKQKFKTSKFGLNLHKLLELVRSAVRSVVLKKGK